MDKQRWFKHYFETLLPKIDLEVISWEKIIKNISEYYLESQHAWVIDFEWANL